MLKSGVNSAEQFIKDYVKFIHSKNNFINPPKMKF